MGLRDRLKQSVRTVLDRFSGEYSAAADEVRPADAPASPPPEAASDAVQVTRARLKRPRDAKESQEPT